MSKFEKKLQQQLKEKFGHFEGRVGQIEDKVGQIDGKIGNIEDMLKSLLAAKDL